MSNFKIGDEVRYKERPLSSFVITHIDAHGNICGIGRDGIAFVDKHPDRWEKTGRYFPEAKMLFDAMEKRKDESNE